MPQVSEEYRRYLEPATLSRIASLELRARMVVEGFLAGMHRGPQAGVSAEFAQHRAYAQGDDLRHLDWKVFGRTDKLYIKQYVQETRLACVLVVDASESMAYEPSTAAHGGGPQSRCSAIGGRAAAWTKYTYSACMAAALAWLALQQGDAVGLAVFDESIRRWIRPGGAGAAWNTVVQALHKAAGGQRTGIRGVLDEIATRLERRALIILISDLLDEPDEVVRGLKHLRYRGHDLIVLQVLDAEELGFPFRGPALFDGLEAAGHVTLDAEEIREQYLQGLRRFTSTLSTRCRALRVDYTCLSTDSPLDVALGRFLAARAATIRI